MLIRHATEADLAAIVAIYNQAIPGRLATADTEAITIESRRTWFTTHQPDRYPLWLATTAEHQPSGWLSLQAFYGRPAYRATAEVSLYVATDQQRQGVGHALLTHAIAQSPALGLRTLLAFIFAHNTASLRLFEQFQFLERGYLPQVAELDGQERDLMILARRLQF
ncbi:MAG: N-acetyltransferase [Spirulinaceae cyanobacterium SM2_1_0]|nr:N-acetyltransferase [Spirulinaceae cyanobacterium SM2_1_0]